MNVKVRKLVYEKRGDTYYYHQNKEIILVNICFFLPIGGPIIHENRYLKDTWRLEKVDYDIQCAC